MLIALLSLLALLSSSLQPYCLPACSLQYCLLLAVAPGDQPVPTPWACSLDLGSPRGDPRIHQNSNLFQGPCQTAKMTPKASQRVPKGYPLDTIFGCFEAPGGNVKTMVSCRRNHRFHGWRGSRDTSCAALCAQCVPTCFSERLFLNSLSIWSPKGVPGEDPKTTFSLTFSTVPPQGVPGKPRVAKKTPRTPK